jgi:hypothetical protein
VGEHGQGRRTRDGGAAQTQPAPAHTARHVAHTTPVTPRAHAHLQLRHVPELQRLHGAVSVDPKPVVVNRQQREVDVVADSHHICVARGCACACACVCVCACACGRRSRRSVSGNDGWQCVAQRSTGTRHAHNNNNTSLQLDTAAKVPRTCPVLGAAAVALDRHVRLVGHDVCVSHDESLADDKPRAG